MQHLVSSHSVGVRPVHVINFLYNKNLCIKLVNY